MNMRSTYAFAVLLLMAVSILTMTFSPLCGQEAETSDKDRIKVFVSILPQAYFVERIGGDHVEVTVLVGPGQSPATYDPTPHEMAHLSDADVYFKIGVPFEKRLLEKAMKMLPDLNVVDTREGITLRYMADHDPHPKGDHKHGEADPHIWLDPALVKIQVSHICDELKRIDPDHADDYDKNLVAFHNDLDALDRRISSLLMPYRGASFYVFHPSYGYFADRYELHQVAIESTGKEPGAKQLAVLTKRARKDKIRAVFIQAQFSTSTAEAIAREIGVGVAILDPLARDYLRNMNHIAKTVAATLSPKNTPADDSTNEDL